MMISHTDVSMSQLLQFLTGFDDHVQNKMQSGSLVYPYLLYLPASTNHPDPYPTCCHSFCPFFFQKSIPTLYTCCPHQAITILFKQGTLLPTTLSFKKLQAENGRTIGYWIFKDLLCCWGALVEIITANGILFIKALDYLAN